MLSLLSFSVTINRRWPGEKLALGDRRFSIYNGSFHEEQHTLGSFADEIAAGNQRGAAVYGLLDPRLDPLRI